MATDWNSKTFSDWKEAVQFRDELRAEGLEARMVAHGGGTSGQPSSRTVWWRATKRRQPVAA